MAHADGGKAAQGSCEAHAGVDCVCDMGRCSGSLQELGGDGIVGIIGEGGVDAGEKLVEAMGEDEAADRGGKAAACKGHASYMISSSSSESHLRSFSNIAFRNLSFSF